MGLLKEYWQKATLCGLFSIGFLKEEIFMWFLRQFPKRLTSNGTGDCNLRVLIWPTRFCRA
jgi:hypothetical protein